MSDRTPLGTRVNMAAVAARMAADEASEEDGSRAHLVYDAGELRSRDLAVMGNISGLMGSGADHIGTTPSKTRGKLWDARQMDGSSLVSAAPASSYSPKSNTGASRSLQSSSAEEEGPVGKIGEAKRKMLALRSSVIDALDVLSAQREDAVIKMKTLQSNTARNNGDALAAINSFDAGYVHLDKVGRDTNSVMAEAGTELRKEFFDAFRLPVRVPSEDTIASYLTRASGRLLSDEEGVQLCNGLRRDVTNYLFPIDDKMIPELICAVNKFTKTDIVRAVNELLGKHDGALSALNTAISETEAQIKIATEKEDLAEAETLTAKLLELSGKRTDIRAVQMILLMGEDEDNTGKGQRTNTASPAANKRTNTSSSPSKRKGSIVFSPSPTTSAAGFVKVLDELLYGSAIPTLKSEKTSLIELAKKDTQKVAANHVKVVRANELDVARYNLATSESRQKMQAIHQKQNEIWEKILELMTELEASGKEKEELAAAHIKATDAEQLRRQDHREYMDSYRRHMVTLEDLVRNGETALRFLKTVEEAFDAAKAEVEASGVEGKLQDILTNQRRAYYDAFSHFGHGSNKHVARYDQRVSNCEYLLKELEFAFKEAPRVGDAEKNSYAERANELNRRKRAAADKAEDFYSAYSVREDHFADVAVRVHLAQRSRAEKLEKGVSSTTKAANSGVGSPPPPPPTNHQSEESELLASLRGTREKALLVRLDRVTAAAERNAASLEEIKQRQLEVEDKLVAEQNRQLNRKQNASALSANTSNTAGELKQESV